MPARGGRVYCFFFQAEDGIRDGRVTGVQTCALPISLRRMYDWTAAEPLGTKRRARVSAGADDVDPFAFLAEDSTPAEQLACARAHAARTVREQQSLKERLNFEHVPRAAGIPLKVAFVSAGFGAPLGVPHATAVLTAAMFENLS